MRDLIRGDEAEEKFFRQYTQALKLWCRRYNTAEIAAYLRVPEPIVCRWIWHWRELSRGGVTVLSDQTAAHPATFASSHVAPISSPRDARFAPGHARCSTFPQVAV